MRLLVVFISGIRNFKKTKENKPTQPRNGLSSWTKLSRGNTNIQSIVCKVGKLILLWDSISPLSEQLSSRTQTTTSVGEGMGEKVHVLTLGGSINWCGHGGCHVSVEASQKAKYKPSYTTHGHLPKDSIFSYKGICSFKYCFSIYNRSQASYKIFFTIFHKVTKWQSSSIIRWEYLETKKKSNEWTTDLRLLIRSLTQTYQISFNLCLSGLWFYKIIAIAVIAAVKMALLMVITNSFTCASGKSHTQVSTIITLLLHKRKWRQRESGSYCMEVIKALESK